MSTAFWKAIYTSGHDAGFVTEQTDGWLLTGTAVYLSELQPVAVRYGLDLAADWSTRSGFIDGVIGTKAIRHRIERDDEGWRLDGERQDGLEDARDLDFGFTPATNHPQLKRMALQIGQSARITVAWFDLGCTSLSPLPQAYRRVSEQAYAYDSPQGPYQATLLIADNGFVQDYPELWQMEFQSG